MQELQFLFEKVTEYALPSRADEQSDAITARARKLLTHIASEIDALELAIK